MAPLIPSAKATLSYPLYACDFDPLDSSRLVVGGGGGAGRSGIGNKITLLDASNPSELEEIGEIDLSKDEDNVTSLAFGGQGSKTLVFAGANSNPKDAEKGTNAHFRVFEIAEAGKSKGKGKGKAKAVEEKIFPNKITEVSRSILFQGSDKDTYQRLLRLSKPYPGQSQFGAIATGLTRNPELVLFDTGKTNPPNSKGGVKGGRETVDLDIIQTGENEYSVAYCDIHDVFLKKISPTTADGEPVTIYETPASRSLEQVTVPQFRGLRWLTKDSICMLTNIHSNGGAVIQILRLPPSGNGPCRVAKSIRLPDRVKKASVLAVANLTPPTSPSGPQDYTQFVIAVAAQDISISLYKVDLQVEGAVSMFSKIKPFRTLKDVHPFQMSGICFSNFEPPPHPVTARTPPQVLKLASVGVSNTVVVHTLPLFPVPLSMKRGQSRTPRYVVALPSSSMLTALVIGLATILVLVTSIILQSVLEIRGGVTVWLNAREYVPPRLQELVGRPYAFPEGYNVVPDGPKITGYNHHLGQPVEPTDPPLPGASTRPTPIRKADFLSSVKNVADATTSSPRFFIQEHSSDNGIVAHHHDEDIHTGHSWDEMTREQREKWLAKLKDAGYWAEDMGETILKGIVFGTLGGMVGQAVGG
ncbi:hypothetical protein BJ875DRAFT_391358 [Amylocarpus encephaloides]|uniref:Guanine nucleotide-exchange factor SEC12 n=1 Tax=Amylocarpus encephaloides TaxID=45428 RepID=A0A9P7YTB3_9HELO|nr:hypothetical protein BJ875DRAFT_391358 [Amylocarpus encephaloides]